MTAKPNVDLDYVNTFKKNPEATKTPSFINWRGDNQYICVYARNGFITGLQYGTFLGIISSVRYRKISHVPLYALGVGALYGNFHLLSAYFRNEI